MSSICPTFKNTPRLIWVIPALIFAGVSIGAAETPAASPFRVPQANAIAEVIETKIICREPGRYLGQGSEYVVDANMHPVIGKRVIEPDRYLGWATLAQTRAGELIAAFSGDRDAHVCPWGKTQIVRSADQGRTWSLPQTITNTPLDDRDAGIIQTQKGTLLVTWFTSMAFQFPDLRHGLRALRAACRKNHVGGEGKMARQLDAPFGRRGQDLVGARAHHRVRAARRDSAS
jgi:hypothetical protein